MAPSHQHLGLAASLADAVVAFGPGRAAAVCREMTKTYEEVRRGPLAELAVWAAEGVRGEITVVLAGASPAPTTDMGELAEQVETLVAGGLRLKDAVAELATGTGISRKALYDAVLAGRTK